MVGRMKMLQGLVLLGAVAGLGLLARGAPELPPKPEPEPEPGEPGVPSAALVESFIGGGKPGDDLPVIVLLHAAGSNPTAAIKLLAPITGPARVLAPVGRYTMGAEFVRFFVDPALLIDAQRVAALAEADRLGAIIDAIVAANPTPVPSRVILIGLGSSGELATRIGLAHPLQVRQSWATGGAVPPAWVPAGLPQLGNLQRPRNRKLTFGDAIALDNVAVAAATKAGLDLSLMQLKAPPTADQVQKWIFPELNELLTTP